MKTRLVLFAALALSLACGGAGDKKPAEPIEPPVADPDIAPAPEVPAGPDAEETLTWVLDKIQSGGEMTAVEIETRFAPSFLKQVPAEKVSAVFKQIAKELGAFKIIKKEGTPPLKVTALLDTQAGVVRVTIGLTSSTPRKMETLLFQPAATEAPPTSYAMVVDQLKKAGASSQFFVAEITKNKCTPAQKHNVAETMAIGSSFKLYVLLGLTRKIKRATKWDTKLPIRDELKSLPSGVLHLQKAGTQLTLKEFAEKMISISDNTATDHLIDFVGRKNVEKAMRIAKHTKPAQNIPFYSTREMFALKLASTEAEREAFRKASVNGKRKLLAEHRKKEFNLGKVGDWKEPRDLDLEWFANGPDICNVYAALGNAGKWDPSSEVLSILAKNAGVPYSKKDWPYLGFKGGSEPGVMSLSWLGKRADGRWFVMTVGVNDKTKALNESAIANAAVGALNVLGKER